MFLPGAFELALGALKAEPRIVELLVTSGVRLVTNTTSQRRMGARSEHAIRGFAPVGSMLYGWILSF